MGSNLYNFSSPDKSDPFMTNTGRQNAAKEFLSKLRIPLRNNIPEQHTDTLGMGKGAVK